MVRSRLSAPATTLPDELVNATCWNQPSRTSTVIGAVGNTSVVLSAGRNVTLTSAGGLAFSDCLLDPPKQAASTFGAKMPTARVVKARRRFTGVRPRAVATTQKIPAKLTPARTRGLERAADQHRLGCECDTKHITDAVSDGSRQRNHVVGAGLAAIRQSKRMLGRQPRARGWDVRITLAETRLLDEPAGGEFDAVGRRIVRHRAADAVSQLAVKLRRDNRIGEKRAHTPGVVIRRVEHHALAGAQTQHSVPDGRGIRALPRRRAQRGDQFGVAQRRAAARSVQRELDLQNDGR